MSKKNTRKRYRLAEVMPAYEEALGTDGGAVEFDGNEDKVFSFPNPLFMDEEMQEALDGASSRDEMAQILLGDQYEDFMVGGNSVEALTMLFGGVARESQEKAQKVRLTRR